MGFFDKYINRFKENREMRDRIKQEEKERYQKEKKIAMEQLEDDSREERINRIKEKLSIKTQKRLDRSKNFREILKDPRDFINSLTGYRDHPGQFFLWTIYLMLIISIGISFDGYPVKAIMQIVALPLFYIFSTINIILGFLGSTQLNLLWINLYEIILTGVLGIIINIWWATSIIKNGVKQGILKTFLYAFRFSFYFYFYLLAITMIYTGNIFGYDTGVGLCGVHQTINIYVGAEPVSCDAESFQNKLAGSVVELTENPYVSGVFSNFEIKDSRGNYFRSDDLERYDINENAGAYIENIEYDKPYFRSYKAKDQEDNEFIISDNIVLRGDLTADKLISDFDTEITIELVPELTPASCVGIEEIIPIEFKARNSGNIYSISGDSGAIHIDEWCSQKWTCNINNAEKISNNIFKLSNNQNTQFSCVRDGLAINKSKVILPNGQLRFANGKPFETNINFIYDTEAIATKQLFLIDQNIIQQQNEPLSYLNIEPSLTNSKSITDKKIEFAIGSSSRKDYIQPTYRGISQFPIENDIILTVDNPKTSKGNVKEMDIELRIFPGSNFINFECDTVIYSEDDNGIVTFENPCGSDINNILSPPFTYGGIKISEERGNSAYHVFNAKNINILSGDRYDTEVTSIVYSELLEGSDYQGILIESILDYKYEISDKKTGYIRELE